MQNIINNTDFNVREALNTINAIAAMLQQKIDEEEARIRKEREEAEFQAKYRASIRRELYSRPLVVTTEKITTSESQKVYYRAKISDGKMFAIFECEPGCTEFSIDNIDVVVAENGYSWHYSHLCGYGSLHYVDGGGFRTVKRTVKATEPYVEIFTERCYGVKPCFGDAKLTYLG